jgi:hypothetical protein
LSRDEKRGTATTEQGVVVAVNPVLSVCPTDQSQKQK